MVKSTMARKATKTRAELIALLKSRGIKGRLSKMTKPQLLAKVRATAPPEKPEEKPAERHMSGLRLEEDQEGGHRFNMKGEVNKTDAKKAKHAHVKSSWPADAKGSHWPSGPHSYWMSWPTRK